MPGARTGPRAVVSFPQRSKVKEWTWLDEVVSRWLRAARVHVSFIFGAGWGLAPLISGSSTVVPYKTTRSFHFLCLHFHGDPCRDRERERKGIAFVWWWDRTARRATWRKKSQQRQSLSPWGRKIQKWKYIPPTRTRLTCNWSEPLHNICCELKPITLLSNGNTITPPSLSLSLS